MSTQKIKDLLHVIATEINPGESRRLALECLRMLEAGAGDDQERMDFLEQYARSIEKIHAAQGFAWHVITAELVGGRKLPTLRRAVDETMREMKLK